MARLQLKFRDSVLREVVVGERPVMIGRAPDSDLQIDNLAVSSLHARLEMQEERLLLEDLSSLNGTFVNNQRIQRAQLHCGDIIAVGKHHLIVVEDGPEAVNPEDPVRPAAPRVDQTVVLDTAMRRELLQRATAAGERSQVAPERMRLPTLTVVSGRTDREEYLLTSKLTVIGKSEMATVRLRGWFAPEVAAQITQRDRGYYIGRGSRIPRVNGQKIRGVTRLMEGDLIEVARVKLRFLYRE